MTVVAGEKRTFLDNLIFPVAFKEEISSSEIING